MKIQSSQSLDKMFQDLFKFGNLYLYKRLAWIFQQKNITFFRDVVHVEPLTINLPG